LGGEQPGLDGHLVHAAQHEPGEAHVAIEVADRSPALLRQLQDTAVQNGNLFDTLMDVTKACSLGQITEALFEVGGQYRRNM